MATVSDHYASMLAPIYVWMAGGRNAAFALGAADLASELQAPGFAIDLGAGFGMHTIPLAQAGWRVLAVDTSPSLLDDLSASASGLPVQIQHGDLLGFTAKLSSHERPDLVLCMGDTLTHLESTEHVAELARTVATRLAPQGRFVATFRDYTRPPAGTARFIPVRADDRRILTCFLEEFDDHVQVHDLLHERAGDTWTTAVSSYPKLRLSPEAARATFEAAGLRATVEAGPRGMVRLVAHAV